VIVKRPRVYLYDWGDMAFGFRISRGMIVFEFWKYMLVIDFNPSELWEEL